MVGPCIVCRWRIDYEPQRRFHRFPRDTKLRKAWLKATGKSVIKESSCVCSLHFTKASYSHKVNGLPYLKPDSVPTLYLKEQPSNMTTERIRKVIYISKQDRSKIPNWKPPPNDRKLNLARRFTCDICLCKFKTANALGSHSRHVHKKILSKNFITKLQNSNKRSAKMPETDPKGTKDPKSYKPSFECPLCEKKFNIYFTALQHIQKLHCVNEDSLKVSPISLDAVKPVRIEWCACNEQVRSDQPHCCPLKMEAQTDKYTCLGCEQVFGNLTLFHIHVKGIHGDEIESYYFPKRSVFNSWKTIVEKQTQTIYAKLSNTTIYQCSHQPKTDNEDTILLCPSTITVKELPNGFHIVFYKTHAGHEYEDFVTPETHKKHCITTFYKDSEDIEDDDQEDEKDLYLQFKKIMKSIILDAAKINISTLNVLLGKAFEMTSVLNSYDEDDDSNVSDKKMSDEQISRVLEDKSLKRKREPLQRDTKRIKNNVKSDPDSPNANCDGVKAKIECPVVPARIIKSPPSFNDSYKTFVDQTIKTDGPKEVKKKEIVKTKIGQFKPTSPKTDTSKTTPKVSSKIETPKHVNTPKSATPRTTTPKVYSKNKTTKVENSKMPIITNVWTVKPEIKYEVKEQDNDCNILILKI